MGFTQTQKQTETEQMQGNRTETFHNLYCFRGHISSYHLKGGVLMMVTLMQNKNQ